MSILSSKFVLTCRYDAQLAEEFATLIAHLKLYYKAKQICGRDGAPLVLISNRPRPLGKFVNCLDNKI